MVWKKTEERASPDKNEDKLKLQSSQVLVPLLEPWWEAPSQMLNRSNLLQNQQRERTIAPKHRERKVDTVIGSPCCICNVLPFPSVGVGADVVAVELLDESIEPIIGDFASSFLHHWNQRPQILLCCLTPYDCAYSSWSLLLWNQLAAIFQLHHIFFTSCSPLLAGFRFQRCWHPMKVEALAFPVIF